MSKFLSTLARSPAAKDKRQRDRKAKAVAKPRSVETPSGAADATESVFVERLRQSGLFDAEFYRQQYPDMASTGADPFDHFFRFGHREGRKPNPLFETSWYLRTYPDVGENDVQPLLHYFLFGEREGRAPGPLFDLAWYREKYGLAADENALAHYVKNRCGPFSPIAEFDAEYYLKTYPDIAAAKIDPFEHYLNYGYKEGRNPSADFDTRFYVQRYFRGKADQNPLVHYRTHRHEGRVHPRAPENDDTIPSQVKRFTRPAPAFEEPRPLSAGTKRRAMVLAYYLTQFHAIPENDKWWGAGFTEWTNIARGLPRFKDHYQPRIPRDLGFYSLADINVMRRQAELAKAAGVHGFVFYYYWFNGKRLLEKPLDQFLRARDIDMPFCLMWANENWTRRWDGLEGEVLIAQDYRDSDDARMCAEYTRHFADPRYIRLQGRPLLMIYRPRLIPDAAKVIQRWRTLFRQNHGEDPILVMSQSFGDFDPTEFGLDGAIEFPPHKHTQFIPQINARMEVLDDSFGGQVFDYDDVARYSLEEPAPAYPLIKTLVPSWDNDARRQGTGLVIHGSTPAKYESWLSALIDRARDNLFFGEPVVCVNAWNEWCEAAYLEPDLHYGSAYLNATARAVSGVTKSATHPRLLLVGHDAFPSGAQHLLLNIGRTLRSAYNVEVEFLLLDGGALEPDYAAVAPLHIERSKTALAARIRSLRERGFASAVANTSACGEVVAMLAAQGIRSILLVHELPRLLQEKGLEHAARLGAGAAEKVVFASPYVRDAFSGFLGLPESENLTIRPQGIYHQITPAPKEAEFLRKQLGLSAQDRLAIGVGYADLRKGFDLFIQAWRLLRSRRRDVHFCWVGGIDPVLQKWLAAEIADATATGTFHMAGYRNDVNTFFSAADAFLLTSREDPFPTVALEAMAAGVPVIAFAQSGGIPDLLTSENVGFVVPYGDAPAMANRLASLWDTGFDARMQDRARQLVDSRFAFGPYVEYVMKSALPDLASVSVVVPNFNYAHCLAERLNTVFDQTYPAEEVIVLDDASSDDSVEVVEAVAEARQRDLTLVINDENSGSVFAQWAKAAEISKGEFIWIAEADDLSEPSFLEAMIAMMKDDPRIAFGFCDSRSIDAGGAPVYASYKPYYASVEPNALTRTEVFEGSDFIARFLSVKNLILNVSAVVWRRQALIKALAACREELKNYRMAGDWRLYLECLSAKEARVAYVADILNVHRRHAQSVTHALKAEQHVGEIARIHQAIRDRTALHASLQRTQSNYVEEIRKQLTGAVSESPRPATAERPSSAPASADPKHVVADRQPAKGDQVAAKRSSEAEPEKKPAERGGRSRPRKGFAANLQIADRQPPPPKQALSEKAEPEKAGAAEEVRLAARRKRGGRSGQPGGKRTEAVAD